MAPEFAQVLSTLAHEMRTPLAVSQGYLKLLLDGRLTDSEENRKALEQTWQALGTLATFCVDMGKISTLADGRARGIPLRVAAASIVLNLREHDGIRHASFSGSGGTGDIQSPSVGDLVNAVAIVARSAFEEARDQAHAIEVREEPNALSLLAGAADVLHALHTGPTAPTARPVDYGRGGNGLRLIWAAFVLERHGVETWTNDGAPACVGIRLPLVHL